MEAEPTSGCIGWRRPRDNVSTTIFHPVGTCRIGRDRRAVVSDRLRAGGPETPRVLDASVMPPITSGNADSPTNKIAKKGVAVVLEDGRM